MYQLPLPSASFDVVLVHQVLHYAEEPAEVLAEAARVLRPGGHLVIVPISPAMTTKSLRTNMPTGGWALATRRSRAG